jgi:outer membrane protein TolC
VLCGCSTAFYKRSADRESLAAIKAKTHRVPNMDGNFTIANPEPVSLAGLPVNHKTADFLAADEGIERDAVVINLDKALEIAVKHSPSYQSRKEDLYLSALELTLARHLFTPLFSSVESGQRLTDNLVEQHQAEGSGRIGVDWLIRDVGRLSTAATTDFTQFFTGGGPGSVAHSKLAATLSRPLLRNNGFKSDIENLTQAERDLLYAMRDFTRFRKSFSVDIASAYYNTLESRDFVLNSYISYQNFKRNVERSKAFAEEGRMTQSDLGRLEQSALNRQAVWINAVRNYKGQLDSFKIQIGLPVDTHLILDERELKALKIDHPEISVEDSIKVALASRLDLLTLHDRCEDAERQVRLATDKLKPQFDLEGSAGLASGNSSRAFPGLQGSNYQWSAGANIDPGFDRKSERNGYRAALISLERAKRQYAVNRDQVQLQVRESYRSLEQAKHIFEIQKTSVDLAQRRVDEQELRAELGLVRAQDQVDAQNDLVNSQNELTQALVTHTIERLRFWANMDILYIKDNGRWYAAEQSEAHDHRGTKANRAN